MQKDDHIPGTRKSTLATTRRHSLLNVCLKQIQKQCWSRLVSVSLSSPFSFFIVFLCVPKKSGVFAHLSCECIVASMFRSVLCLLQLLRFLPSRMGCNRVVMGDTYRYRNDTSKLERVLNSLKVSASACVPCSERPFSPDLCVADVASSKDGSVLVA